MDPPSLPPGTMKIPPQHAEQSEHSLPGVEDMRTESAISSPTRSPSKSRRILFLVTVCVVAMTAIIGISIAISSSGGSSSSSAALGGSTSSDPNSPGNSKKSRHQKVQNFLSFYSERSLLEKKDTPQYLASQWIADIDLRALEIPSSSDYDVSFAFVQRYILAVFFYTMGGSDWKFDSEFVSPRDECDWNFALRADAAIPGSGSARWVMGASCNEGGEVNKIFLPGNNLVGELPDELGLLIGLEHLSLFSNELAGELPENMQYLVYLNFLAMESNLFSGSIPDWISAWRDLEYLALGDNQFTGKLPSFADLEKLVEVAIDDNFLTGSVEVFNDALALEVLFLSDNGFDNEIDGDLFYNLSNLRILDMSSNKLGGFLPAQFFSVEILDLHNNSISAQFPEVNVDDSPLTFLSIFSNDLTGVIPDSIAKLTGLTHLDVSYNSFTGAIPGAAINSLTQLVYLFMGENPFEFGDFPPIWDLVNLEEISLKNARRGNSIPDWISSEYFPELILLDLHANGFSGELPQELGSLSNLAFLMLNRNELTGNIPDSFNNLSNLALIFMDTNRLTGNASPLCVDGPDFSIMSADCEGNDAEVVCGCCQVCCAPGDTACNAQEIQANIDDGYSRDEWVFSEDLIFNQNADTSN